MSSTPSYRTCIERNKKAVLTYLYNKGYRSTGEICDTYSGEKDMYQVRNALKELCAEGLVKFKIRGQNSKYWALINYTGSEN